MPEALPLPASSHSGRLHLLPALEERHLAAEDDAGDTARRVGRRGDGLPELLRDPRVAPPDHSYVAGVVADNRLGGADAPAAPEPHLVRLPEHGFYRLLLTHAQLSNSGPLPAVDVTQGEEVEEVADGGLAGVREHLPPDKHLADGIRLRAVAGPQRAQGHVERVANRWGGRFRRRSGTPVRTGGRPGIAEEAASLVRPALAARRVEFRIGDGEEAALVQRSERRVRSRLSTERFEEAVEAAGDGPVGEAVGRLHVEDVAQGPHLGGASPSAALRRHLRSHLALSRWVPAFAGMTDA